MAIDRTVVFVAYGSFGDVFPLLPIAQKLQMAGRRVLFIANEHFADSVHRAGVPYEQAGTSAEQFAARETATSNGDTFEGAMVRYDNIIGCNYSRVGAILRRMHAAGEHPLVVTHGFMSPAFPACEQLEIPIVITYYAPAQIPDNREDYVLYRTSFGRSEWFARHVRYPLHCIKTRVHDSPYSRYNEWRQQAGFGRTANPLISTMREVLRGGAWKLRQRHPCVVLEMALFPEWFAEPVGEDIRHVKFIDFVFHRDTNARNDGLADEFIARHGSPLVFTPGTAVEDTRTFCAAIGEACRLLQAPAIVLSRYAAEAMSSFDFAASGAQVLALDHVDLGYLLPKARLLVHHGGIGTLAQAVRAGIPQIIRPRMYDQPVNGLRVALNGLGGMLYDDGYNGAEIASVYRHVTTSELHRERISYYGELTRRQDGAASAAEHIASCLDEPRVAPLLAPRATEALTREMSA